MKINRKDILLAVVICLIAGIIYLVMTLTAGEEGSRVEITIDGEIYGTYSLKEDQTIEISEEAGTNVVVIRDGKVWMEEADCPDGYCKDQGKISKVNQTIVCLPHKLVVGINSTSEEKADEETVDTIAQ